MTPKHMLTAWNRMRRRNGYPPLRMTARWETAFKNVTTKFINPRIASLEFLMRFYEKNRVMAGRKHGLAPSGLTDSFFVETVLEEHALGMALGPEYLERAGPPPDQGFTAYKISALDDFIKFLIGYIKRTGNVEYPIMSPAGTTNPAWLRLAAIRFLAELGMVSLETAEEAAEVYGQEAWDDFLHDPSVARIFDNWILTAYQCFGEKKEIPVPDLCQSVEEMEAETEMSAYTPSSREISRERKLHEECDENSSKIVADALKDARIAPPPAIQIRKPRL